MITLLPAPRASPRFVSESLASTATNTSHNSARDHISFSAISTYQRCSLRYFFKYIAGLPEETVSASFVFGRAIHNAIEFHFTELMAGNNPPDLDTLLAEFNAGWDEQPPEQIQYPKTDSRDSLARLADRMLQAFRASDVAQPRGRVIGIEEELRGKVVEGTPDVLARLDLLVQVADGLRVTDFKTAKNA